MLKFFQKKESKSGFTLIELLVVIAIIGLLASIVLASLNTARRKSRDARRIADAKQIQLALELYFDANGGTYPAGTDMSVLATTYISQVPASPSPGSYSYQALTSASAACAATPCVGYVVRAQLEDSTNQALGSDVDGTVVLDCTDTSAAPYYCVRP